MKYKLIYNFKHDAVRVTNRDTRAVNVNVFDLWTWEKPWLWFRAHVDAFQIIPNNGKPNDQYSLASISDVVIKFCSVISNSKIQPVLCTDGILINVDISNNVFETKSQHHISLNGCLSGKFYDNIANGDPAKVVLKPARIGGGENVWILSFANTHRYGKVYGNNIADLRNTPQRGINMVNFDVTKFKKLSDNIPNAITTSHRTRMLRTMALQCGEIV